MAERGGWGKQVVKGGFAKVIRMHGFQVLLLGILLLIFGLQPAAAAEGSIRIGFNIPLTGEFATAGKNARNIAEMVSRQLNAEGGVTVGGKRYEVECIYRDNSSTGPGASAGVLELASKAGVHGMIGPLSSRQAVPAGGVANAYGLPMISSWSTSPVTTRNRPFVFRSGYLVGVQAPVLTKFVGKHFGATTAAVLYDIVNTYPRFMAKDFKAVFEGINGPGSVKAFEEFRTGDQEFGKQLKVIIDSGADILFTPQHYNEVPEIVRQAREMGWNKPIIGSNSWAGGDIVAECGADCTGLFFVGNYAPGGAEGKAKDFVEAYKEQFGIMPDEVAGLTWDALWVLIEAIRSTGGLTGDLVTDRTNIRDRLAEVRDFEGVSGTMSFNTSGDPTKCAMMIRIGEDGILTRHETVCP